MTEDKVKLMHDIFQMIPYRKPPYYKIGLVCADGFKVSVQASEYHYCSPRESGIDLVYSSFELGFPSEKEDLIMEYAEDADKPTDTVYGFVPADVVYDVIQKHGGPKP